LAGPTGLELATSGVTAVQKYTPPCHFNQSHKGGVTQEQSVFFLVTYKINKNLDHTLYRIKYISLGNFFPEPTNY